MANYVVLSPINMEANNLIFASNNSVYTQITQLYKANTGNTYLFVSNSPALSNVAYGLGLYIVTSPVQLVNLSGSRPITGQVYPRYMR